MHQRCTPARFTRPGGVPANKLWVADVEIEQRVQVRIARQTLFTRVTDPPVPQLPRCDHRDDGEIDIAAVLDVDGDPDRVVGLDLRFGP